MVDKLLAWALDDGQVEASVNVEYFAQYGIWQMYSFIIN